MNKTHFPIFRTHPRLVYLDNAASAQVPQQTLDAINEYYCEYKSNVNRGIYQLSEIATHKYSESRDTVARFINADPNEIIFTGGMTEGINNLANSLSYKLKRGDTIITTMAEHHSTFLPFQRIANNKNLSLKYININNDLTLNIKQYTQLLKEGDAKLVVISGLSNVTGYITPIKELTKLAHDSGAEIIIDASQYAPHIKIDVKELDIDYLIFSGHKLYGPTGIGVLYGKEKLLNKLEPLKVGGGMIKDVEKYNSTWAELPERHEAGTPNISGALGLAASIDYLMTIGMENIEHMEKNLTEYTIGRLSKIKDIQILTPTETDARTSVISIYLKQAHPHDIADILDKYKIAVRAGHHCAQLLMREHFHLPATARISLGLYNDKDDIKILIRAIKEVIRIFS